MYIRVCDRVRKWGVKRGTQKSKRRELERLRCELEVSRRGAESIGTDVVPKLAQIWCDVPITVVDYN